MTMTRTAPTRDKSLRRTRPPRPAAPAAAIYSRISQDKAGGGLGVQRQEDDCDRLARDTGVSVVARYVDNDMSAYSGKPRPGYLRLLDDVRAGRVQTVLCWHTDRLHRSPLELEEWITAAEAHGVAVVTVKAGPLDLATPAGRMVARQLGAVARYESEHRSERVRRKMEQNARDGKPHGGGQRPYGYESDRVTVRPDEAEVIREAAARVLAGETLRSVYRDLNARGLLTSAGKPWRSQTLHRILTGARISGQREVQERDNQGRRTPGAVVAPAAWPAIITPEQTTQLRRILLDRDRYTGPQSRTYPLTGRLRCGRCGKPMAGKARDGVRRYMCHEANGCGRMFITAAALEDYLTEAVSVALDSPEFAAALEARQAGDAHASELAERLTALEERRDELARDWASGDLSRREWLAARQVIDRQHADLDGRLAAARQTVTLHDLGDVVLSDVGWSRRRAVLDAVLERVTIHPVVLAGSKRFDPRRVELTWRV